MRLDYSHSKTLETHQQIVDHFQIEYLTTFIFLDPLIIEKIQRRCERKLKKTKHKKFNDWTLSLFGNDLKEQKEIPFIVKKVNPLIGYGVFAKKKIAPLTFIGEYTGFIRKRKWFKDSHNDYVFGYVVGPDDTPWVIDADKGGNFTRFINHSYTPNITSRWIIHEGMGHILFFANKAIEEGEQITYDYGPYYWRKRPYPMAL